jgi:DoxX-like protein
MFVSGVLYLIGPPPLMAALRVLGYPEYFLHLLGAAKLLGAAALFAPPRSRLREWAYAGFTFDLSFAVASHLAAGHAADVVPPLAALGLLGASYGLRISLALAQGSGR